MASEIRDMDSGESFPADLPINMEIWVDGVNKITVSVSKEGRVSAYIRSKLKITENPLGTLIQTQKDNEDGNSMRKG